MDILFLGIFNANKFQFIKHEKYMVSLAHIASVEESSAAAAITVKSMLDDVVIIHLLYSKRFVVGARQMFLHPLGVRKCV